MLINDNLKNPNRNKAFIYTTECTLCGHAKVYSPIINKLKEKGIESQVKQVGLWRGWAEEAAKIGIEMPFVWFFNTQKGKTIDDALENGIDDILI